MKTLKSLMFLLLQMIHWIFLNFHSFTRRTDKIKTD